MSRRDRVRVIAAAVALVVIVATIGWTAYALAKRQAEENRGRLAAEEEAAKSRDAKDRMRVLDRAVKKYYTEHLEWPPVDNLELVVRYLKDGRNGLLDPWGQPITLRIVQYQDETDGTLMERPLLMCRTPAGEAIRWPER